MLEAVGHAVSRLIRIRYGAMLLPRGLKRGAWMELDDADIDALRKASSWGAGQGSRTTPSEPGNAHPAGTGNRNRKRGGRSGGQGRGPEAPRDARGPAQPGGGNVAPGRGRNRDRIDQDDSGERADRQAAESQPDPMKTAFGYIGADSFTKQRQGQGQRRGPGRGNGGGQPGGGGGRAGAGGGGGNNRRGGRGR